VSSDGYRDSEAPTRPDLPRHFAATLCAHCGRVFGEHADMFPIDMDALCLGLKRNFAPTEIDDPTR
jgi:hypothetical protein